MEVSKGNKLTLTFTIQASRSHLKSFFKSKDAIEGYIKESGIVQNSTSETFYHCFRFFEEHQKLFQQSIEDHLSDEKTSTDLASSPVIKIYLSLSQDQIDCIQNSINSTKKQLLTHFEKVVDNSDSTYFFLNCVFGFVIKNQTKFNDFIKSNFQPQQNIAKQCLICLEGAVTLYCDTPICLKCKYFFQDLMRRRTLLSLRCSKNGACFSNMKNSDISCRKCRFDRCRLANMVEQYCNIELPELVIRSCFICRKSDENNKPVMGFSLCPDCRNAFDELSTNFHDINPVCLEEPECRCATFECRKCLKEKFVQFGIFQTYTMKLNGMKKPLQCWEEYKCCVCLKKVETFSQEKWMDLTVCVCCQAFLKNSLENDNHANYCCPYGEIGRLCPLNRSKVCPYCWFARCEIEGLVERWQLCNGDSEKWNEIISGFEYDTSSDDDEDDDDE